MPRSVAAYSAEVASGVCLPLFAVEAASGASFFCGFGFGAALALRATGGFFAVDFVAG